MRVLLGMIGMIFFFNAVVFAETPNSNMPLVPNQLDTVVLQLRWKHQFQFAGYYAAIENGYYRDVGLEVKLVEGSPYLHTVEEVLAGRAQFGVTNSEILLHRLQGESVVLLAPIFQHSPLIIVVPYEEHTDNPQKLIGRQVKMSRSSRDVEIHAMFKNEGVSLDEIVIVGRTVKPDDYFTKEIDALTAYMTNELFYFEQRHVPYATIRPISYGIDFYGDCLFTTENQVKEYPQRVKAFRAASLKGWKYAMDYPDRIIDLIINRYGSQKSREHLRFEAEKMRELILPNLVELGHVNLGRWKHIANTFARLGMTSSNYSLKGFLYDPDPKPDITHIRWMIGVLLGLSSLIGIIALTLLFFNKRLQREVVERKQTEQKLVEANALFLAVLDQSPAGIIVALPPDSRIHLVNEQAKKITGQDFEGNYSIDTLDKFSWKAFFEDGTPWPLENTPLARAIIYGEKTMNQEMIIRKADGVEKCILINASPVYNDKEEIIAGIAAFPDITERKQAEAALRESEEKLARSKKMEALGLMAGGVAHDLNNILSGIVTYPELMLLDDSLGENTRKSIEMIKNSGDRAAAVVEDLLTVTRGAATAKTDADLNTIVKEYFQSPEFIQLKEKHPHIAYRTYFFPEKLIIKCSPVHIKKTTMNLIINASEAIEGNGEVVISTDKKFIVNPVKGYDKILPGDYAIMKISDTGPGITEQDMERIFEPFYTKKIMGRSGTGLGLTVVWNTVQDHNGYIVIDRNNHTTVFELFFPVAEEGKTVSAQTPILNDYIGNNEKILIVDDDKAQRQIAKELLTRLKYRVETVSSGEEAVAYLKENTVDLLVLDMIMEPGINGRETFEQIVAFKPDQKVVIVSGFAETRDVRFILDYGTGQFLKKPYTIQQFGLAVKNGLRNE